MEVLDLIFISFYHKKTHLISLHVRKGASWSIGFPCNLVLWELGSVDLVPVSSWKLVLTLLDFIWAFLNLDFADQRNNVISWFFCYFTFLLFFPVLILDMKLSTYDHFLRWRTEGISPAFIFFFWAQVSTCTSNPSPFHQPCSRPLVASVKRRCLTTWPQVNCRVFLLVMLRKFCWISFWSLLKKWFFLRYLFKSENLPLGTEGFIFILKSWTCTLSLCGFPSIFEVKKLMAMPFKKKKKRKRC